MSIEEKWDLSKFQTLRHRAGVYFLYKDIQKKETKIPICVYIGQSKDIYTRVLEHIAESRKDFEYVKAVEINDEYLRLSVEERCIYGACRYPMFYNIDIVKNFDSFKYTYGIIKNKYFKKFKKVIHPENAIEEKVAKIIFIHFFYLMAQNQIQNSISLEKQYLTNYFENFIILHLKNKIDRAKLNLKKFLSKGAKDENK